MRDETLRAESARLTFSVVALGSAAERGARTEKREARLESRLESRQESVQPVGP
jgi:hypothetical protein